MIRGIRLKQNIKLTYLALHNPVEYDSLYHVT